MRRFGAGLLFLVASCVAGCGGDDVGPLGAHAIFVLDRAGVASDDYFALPWPTDLRRTADGHVDVRGFPNPRHNAVIGTYLEAISTRIEGWANNGSIYFRFSDPVDPASLPATVVAATAPDASVSIVDIDPRSPELGTRWPAEVSLQREATVFWNENTVAIRPMHGIPLAGDRRYAAVVTRRVRPAAGGSFARDTDLDAIFGAGGDADVVRARSIYAPALDALASAGIARDDVLSLAVFTTQDPTADLIAMRDWLAASYAEPAAVDTAWRFRGMRDGYIRLEGRYSPAPTFQQGDSPYSSAPSGEIVVGADGAPIVAGEFEMAFALTLPMTPAPAAGYPIVLYAHGTGGDHTSFIDDGTAELLAAQGYAVMGIDQPLHAARNPTTSTPDILFFNFLNPYAGRDNVRQAALDVVQQARFAATLEVPTRLVATGGAPLKLDRTRMYFFGHSQGGLNGGIFLGIEPGVHGGVLSGAGGTLAISLFDKVEPLSIPQVVVLLLGLAGATPAQAFAAEGFDYSHPAITMLATFGESADPVNYAPLYFHAPRPGAPPKSIFQTEGLLDPYTPPLAIESLASSARIPLVEPVVRAIPALDQRGIASVTGPVTGNVAGGAATAGLIQVSDMGHFVVFDDPAVRTQLSEFFRTFDTDTPTIP